MQAEVEETQLESVKKKLVALKKNITIEDKKQCQSELRISQAYVSVALSGKGGTLQKLIPMLQILTTNVQSRENILKELEK